MKIKIYNCNKKDLSKTCNDLEKIIEEIDDCFNENLLNKNELNKDEKTPDYYKLNIKGVDFDINDILESLSKKIYKNCSNIQFNYLSNAIEYLFRSYRKGQLISDLEKAKNEIEFLINNIKKNG